MESECSPPFYILCQINVVESLISWFCCSPPSPRSPKWFVTSLLCGIDADPELYVPSAQWAAQAHILFVPSLTLMPFPLLPAEDASSRHAGARGRPEKAVLGFPPLCSPNQHSEAVCSSCSKQIFFPATDNVVLVFRLCYRTQSPKMLMLVLCNIAHTKVSKEHTASIFTSDVGTYSPHGTAVFASGVLPYFQRKSSRPQLSIPSRSSTFVNVRHRFRFYVVDRIMCRVETLTYTTKQLGVAVTLLGHTRL